MSKTFQITNGPSREELFDGLRLHSEKRLISFVIDNNGREMKPTVSMSSIEAEDGSGESWNIHFCIQESFIGKIPYPIDVTKKVTIPWVRVRAYYSTKNRKGTITVE